MILDIHRRWILDGCRWDSVVGNEKSVNLARVLAERGARSGDPLVLILAGPTGVLWSPWPPSAPCSRRKSERSLDMCRAHCYSGGCNNVKEQTNALTHTRPPGNLIQGLALYVAAPSAGGCLYSPHSVRTASLQVSQPHISRPGPSGTWRGSTNPRSASPATRSAQAHNMPHLHHDPDRDARRPQRSRPEACRPDACPIEGRRGYECRARARIAAMVSHMRSHMGIATFSSPQPNPRGCGRWAGFTHPVPIDRRCPVNENVMAVRIVPCGGGYTVEICKWETIALVHTLEDAVDTVTGLDILPLLRIGEKDAPPIQPRADNRPTGHPGDSCGISEDIPGQRRGVDPAGDDITRRI